MREDIIAFFISAVIIYGIILLIHKMFDVAKDEVEYMVEPSGSMVILNYRFKGEWFWKAICGPYDGEYGSFVPRRFIFREDGNYEYLKKEYTKEKIEELNANNLSQYNQVENERREEKRRLKANIAKRI